MCKLSKKQIFYKSSTIQRKDIFKVIRISESVIVIALANGNNSSPKI